MNDFPGPAYRVETSRLTLRCFRPEDTSSVSRAVEESIEHLRPWLTWTVHEPLSFDERLTWVRTQRGHFDLGSDYCFGAFSKEPAQEQPPLVGVGLLRMTGTVHEREVGYWIHAQHIGQGLGTELVSALVRVAFDVEQLDALEIRTFTHNRASARIAAKLGFSGPVVDPLSYPLPSGDKVDLHVYGLSRVEYAASPARACTISAYDALDRQLC